jgi:hypothetical protein
VDDEEDEDEGEDEEVAHFGFWGIIVLLHLNWVLPNAVSVLES